MKSPYKLRANDEDKEGVTTLSDDENGSEDKSDSSSDGSSNDSGHDDDVDYYGQDIEDDAEANRWSYTGSDQCRLINVLENVREENAQANQMYHDEYPYRHLSEWNDITNVNSRSGPRYDKHGREVPKLGSYYDSEPSSLTSHTKEEDDIGARLAALDQKLLVHNLGIMTLENAERNEERMEESES